MNNKKLLLGIGGLLALVAGGVYYYQKVQKPDSAGLFVAGAPRIE